MKLTITNIKSLHAALKTIQPALSERTTLPILSMVRIIAGSIATVTASNLDMCIMAEFEAETHMGGSVCVPGKTFSRILEKLDNPDSPITIECNLRNEVTIRSGEIAFTLIGMPTEEFPPFSEITDAKYLEVSTMDAFKNLLGVEFAISTDSNRYVLNGALLEAKDGILKAVATDGRRLCMRTMEAGSETNAQMLLPNYAIRALLEIESDHAVKIWSNGSAIRFKIGAITVWSKLIEGNYPNYAQVIPDEEQLVREAVINRLELLNAIRAVLAIKSNDEHGKFTFDQSTLTVKHRMLYVGDASASIPQVFKGGWPFTIGLKLRFVKDFLESTESELITVKMSDEYSPSLFISEDSRYILMPVRLS